MGLPFVLSVFFFFAVEILEHLLILYRGVRGLYCGAVQEVIRVKKLNIRVPLGTVRVESQTRNQINTQAKGLIPIRETNLVQTVNQRSRINKAIVDGRSQLKEYEEIFHTIVDSNV